MAIGLEAEWPAQTDVTADVDVLCSRRRLRLVELVSPAEVTVQIVDVARGPADWLDGLDDQRGGRDHLGDAVLDVQELGLDLLQLLHGHVGDALVVSLSLGLEAVVVGVPFVL